MPHGEYYSPPIRTGIWGRMVFVRVFANAFCRDRQNSILALPFRSYRRRIVFAVGLKITSQPVIRFFIIAHRTRYIKPEYCMNLTYTGYDVLFELSKRGVDMSPVSKAHMKATAKYMKANYDEFKVRTPKGKKEQVQEHTASTGESMNAFINRAIQETMERDKGEHPQSPRRGAAIG